MHRGYVKIWRKMFDSEIQKHPELLSVWVWILAHVSYKDTTITTKYGDIQLQPGEMIVGRKKLSENFQISEMSIRTILKKLEKSKKLTIKTTNKYSIIRVVNWGTYQSDEEKLTSTLTNNQPTSNQQITTDQECKRMSKKEKKIKRENFIFPESYSETLKSKFMDFIDNRKSMKKPVTEKAFSSLVNKLGQLSNGNESSAIEILDNSIQSGWSGIFPLKNNNSAKGGLNLDTRNKVYTGTPEDELRQRPWMRGDKAV